MRHSGRFDLQSVACHCTHEQHTEIVAAESEVYRHLRQANDADMRPISLVHLNAAGAGTIDPPLLVDLHTIGNTGLFAALISESLPVKQIAFRSDIDGVNVLRHARIGDLEGSFIRRQRQAIRIFNTHCGGDTLSVRRYSINPRSRIDTLFPTKPRLLALLEWDAP